MSLLYYEFEPMVGILLRSNELRKYTVESPYLEPLGRIELPSTVYETVALPLS